MKQIQELLQIRKSKGNEIAKNGKIKMNGYKWIVPSQSSNKQYEVILRLDKSVCTCPDFIERGIKCKHIFAVEITLTKTVDNQGNTTITKRITYKQDWVNYTKAQNEEGRLFKELLKDLVENVQDPVYTFGRPKISLKTALFCSIDKVYSMQSSRRAYSRYKDAEDKAQIEKAPNYNAINKILNNPSITPILNNLLHITAMPLKSVESRFATDATGFRTTQFNEYCKNKHKTGQEHKWIKCHATTGTNTNIITSARITDGNGSDCIQFIPLMQDTLDLGFGVEEASADKAYSSRDNVGFISENGGVAYIPYRSNATGKPRGKSRMWRDMFLYFQLHQEEFLEHYHNRSNIETTFMAIKFKFGDCLKNKTFTSQTNEILCKLIAYNITVLISAMFELKIDPNLHNNYLRL